jgi:bacterioferritin-associated ferredoxin
MTEDPTPAHFVCRCEEIREAEVVAAIAAGARTINDLKRQTRAGMGACQGVFCVRPLALLLRDHVPPDRIAPMTARPPVRPLPLDRLADLES